MKRLISDTDAEATRGVLSAGHRGEFQASKAGTRGTHTVRNLVIASSTVVGTFLSGAVASDYATKSELIKHAGGALAEAEQYIEKLLDGMQEDIRIAIKDLLKEMKRRKLLSRLAED